MSKPHKHAELIKAWADGAKIECKGLVTEEWYLDICPTWNPVREYRIKPEPKPDVVKYLNQLNYILAENKIWEQDSYQITKNCIKLTFDGETGELKSAEVLR